MQELTSRTLRTWAVAQVVYGVVLAIVLVVYIPWKTPIANVLGLAYCALHAAGAAGLWRGRRWGWRVSLIAGLVGLVACVLVCSALVASWAYLRAVFGDFGRGASIAALLFASVGLQVLGLFPALQLRALLRREVRADIGAGRGLVGALWGLLSLPWVLAVIVFAHYDMRPLAPVSDEGRSQALAALRVALSGDEVEHPNLSALEGVPVGPGDLYVTVWYRGNVAARVRGRGRYLDEAVREAATALARSSELSASARRGGELKVDRVVAVGSVASEWGPVLALSVNPGLDGLRRCHHWECQILLPDDLVRDQRFGAAPLIPGIREIRLGLNSEPVLAELEGSDVPLERVRTESWVDHGGQAVPVVRGNTPSPGTGPDAWRRAAVAGGDFILRQLMDDGRFHYIYEPLTDRRRGSSTSSIPRHAGTVYALALLYGHTRSDRFRRGAERGIEWLATQIPERCGGAEGACVARGDRAQLGSTALTVVGILEYQRRTGDERYAAIAERLVAFIRDMQRPDGDFDHLYDLRRREVLADERLMFASEEAAFALVMANEVLGGGEPDENLTAAERALDYLTSEKYDYFLGRFMYGADHWTCIAAEEAYPRLQDRQYLDFCRGYAEFMRRIQYQPGEWNNRDFTGHYGFGAIMVPQAPAAAGFTEAIASTAALSRQHGVDDSELVEQAALALDALARDQIRDDNAYMMPRPGIARGGIRRSLVEEEIRIDFTQHAVCALVRGWQLERRPESSTRAPSRPAR